VSKSATAVPKSLVAGAAAALLALLVAVVPGAESQAAPPAPAPASVSADAASFDPGYIIDDSKFFDPNAMSVAEIQAFLNSKVPNCAAGFTCLRSYSETTRTIPATPMCSTYEAGANESAATIIWKVAQACGISPKVILVTLQKEQGLVTKSAPSAGAFRSAMGAGCPDTAPCDTEYYGFFNQVHYGAFLFKRYTQPPGTGAGTPYPTRFDQRYAVGSVSQVLWHPNAACGTSPVYIANQATHALYVYTPYQPNAAALANLYGTGDGCSSYGNRNFWAYYTDWFGPTTGSDQPIGNVDGVTSTATGVSVRGWAFDPNSGDPIEVAVTVNGGSPVLGTADGPRPDVAGVFPGRANHGFEIAVPLGDGEHSVCVTGRNVGVGANVLLGCRTVEVHVELPWGRVDVAQPTELGALVSGWALDPDSTGAIWMHVYVDGAFWSGIRADGPRGDVQAAISGAGPAHGYRFEVPLAAGEHRICAYGINEGPGAMNTELFCRTVVVPTRVPRGHLDAAGGVSDGIVIAGWALDPSSSVSTWLHVYVDGGFAMGVLADGARPDVAAVFPGTGSNHGFSARIPATPGLRNVCVFAFNAQSDKHLPLGCRAVTVGSVAPLGSLDEVRSGAGTISFRGWTFDPNSTQTTWAHVYVDGVFATGAAADKSRPDVASVHPNAGGARGFDASIGATPGVHSVCVYGLSSGSAPAKPLGCRTVTVG